MKTPTKPIPALPLCHRCEQRAVALETGFGPRYECSRTGTVGSCYCYEPVAPLVMEANAGDKRMSPGPWMISARAHAVAIAETSVAIERRGKKWVAWRIGADWKPEKPK